MRVLSGLIFATFALTGCDDGSGPVRPDAGFDSGTLEVDSGADDAGAPSDDAGGEACAPLTLTEAAAGLRDPILVTAPPGDPRLFVVEIGGRVQIVEDDAVTGTFLDLSGTVSVAGDHGLNGMAFHPDFATNGQVFVSYAFGRGMQRIARFTTSAPDTLDPTSETTILEVTLPEAAHTSGHLAFGGDGNLYIGIGDGQMNPSMALAQNLDSLAGKILRIDVDGAEPFAIPADNPFASMPTARDEIWAYGFRLPYRFSFDELGLFVGEVGDGSYEEVDLVQGGGNYGWPEVEGNMHCHTPPTGCDTTSSQPPIHEFEHTGGRCAMMGGFVYRGSALPACNQGRYFYADFCTGQVTSFGIEGGATPTAVDVQDGPAAPTMVVSWGRGGDGELYVVGMNGRLYQLTAAP